MPYREPRGAPSLDTITPSSLRDPHPAEGRLLRTIDDRHHALSTAWGWPSTWRSVDWTAALSATTSWYLPWRVPPGVTEVDVVLLVSGKADVAIISNTDAVGSSMAFDSRSKVMLRTAGPAPAGIGGPRSVTVRAAVAWGPVDEQLKISLTTSLWSGLTRVWGVGLIPVHEDRSV